VSVLVLPCSFDCRLLATERTCCVSISVSDSGCVSVSVSVSINVRVSVSVSVSFEVRRVGVARNDSKSVSRLFFCVSVSVSVGVSGIVTY